MDARLAKRKDDAATGKGTVFDPGPRSFGGDLTSLISRFETTNAVLGEQVRRFEAALDNMTQGLCMFDGDERLVVCNRRYLEIFDLSPAAVPLGIREEEICRYLISLGRYPPSVSIEAIQERRRLALTEATGLPLFRELANGRFLSVNYRPMKGGGWVSTFEDITEQQQSAERIRHLASHDGLTELVNARTLRAEAQDLFARTAGAGVLVSAKYLDLDRFKFVNDTYGHCVGDELLRAVAQRILDRTERNDIAGRLGGDEFAVVGLAESEACAVRSAEALMAALALPYDLSSGRIEIGVSIGIALSRRDTASSEELLQDADLALRHAKTLGRGVVSLFDPSLAETARSRRSLEAELRAAIADEQFELNYQPLVEIKDGRTVAVEALLRWQHPEKGSLPPGTFIQLAEETGLIIPLGRWVMERACRDAVAWPDAIPVAVNVSGIQMRQKSFADMVLAALAASGLAAARLEIELTESALLDDCETTMHNIERLREAGIRFAMDDFGTGYSSLSYLRRFPIHKIKIDRSFMKDAEGSPDALAIIRAVTGLGVSLGITTLVEGVETRAQLEVARAEGIEQVQGYFFSRPQPEPVIRDRLRGESLAMKREG